MPLSVMKSLVALAALVTFCYGSPTHLIPGDNSHYVEGQSRYIWMTDGDGAPQLVDLEEQPTDEQIREVERNGARNEYWLFTRSNPRNAQIVRINDNNSVSNSNYRAGSPIIVIVHGWNGNGNTALNPQLTAAFLSVMDANVFVVDWRRTANQLYTLAQRGVPSVGQHLGDFLNWLVNSHRGNWNQMHLLGFSLGAHVVGNAGRRTGNRPNRITGLDPAGPYFGGNSNALRASDGRYTECIHTDGHATGIMDPICRANIYPNGGRHRQPGCGYTDFGCSHNRAHRLMESSVYNDRFVARQCHVWNNLHNCNGASLRMGNAQWNKNGQGWFWVPTGSSWPF